jgi:hypothetical protein
MGLLLFVMHCNRKLIFHFQKQGEEREIATTRLRQFCNGYGSDIKVI